MPELDIKSLLDLLYMYNMSAKSKLDQQEITGYSEITELASIPCIIPSQTYNPKIKVVIDFMSQFTLDFVEAGKDPAKGERLVTPDLLLRYAKDLCNFWAYYFNNAFLPSVTENTFTNARAAIQSKNAALNQFFTDTLKKLNANNEEEANIFINQIINLFVTGVQVQRSIKDIGTCALTLRDNFSVAAPKLGASGSGRRDTLFFQGVSSILNQLFSPLLPIAVWAKGRLYPDKWFPIFTGYIFQLLPSEQDGFTTIVLQCRDALELARISSENINPAILQYRQIKSQNALQLYSNAFYQQTLTQIVTTMFLGGKAQETIEDTIDILQAQTYNPKKDPRSTSTSSIKFNQLGDYIVKASSFDYAYPHGHNDNPIDNNHASDLKIFLDRFNLRPQVFIWGENITPYKMFSMASPKTFHTQFSTRYDILKAAATFVYFDFYADAYGNIQFHPMKFANKFFMSDAIYADVSNKQQTLPKDYPSTYIVSPHETLKTNTLFNLQGLVTYLRLGGAFPTLQPGEENAILINYLGVAADTVYMKKYGFRMCEVYDEVFNYNPRIETGTPSETFRFLDLCARELLKYKNGELWTRTTEIVFRPEIELANPILFTDLNQVFYIQSISHNISIGGTATTTINCNFGRAENESPPMLFDFLVTNQKIWSYKRSEGPEPDYTQLAALFKAEADRYVFPFSEADRQADLQAMKNRREKNDTPAKKDKAKKAGKKPKGS